MLKSSLLAFPGSRMFANGRRGSKLVIHTEYEPDQCESSSTRDSGNTSASGRTYHGRVRSFHRRSTSVCSFDERFAYRREALVRESRSNPYIGYFLRHDRQSRDPRRISAARYLKPSSAMKAASVSSTATSSPAPTPSTTVRFSNTVRKSNLVMTHWDGESRRGESPLLPILTSRPNFYGQYMSHGVPF